MSGEANIQAVKECCVDEQKNLLDEDERREMGKGLFVTSERKERSIVCE